jgi:hypothetical protein
MKGKLITLIVLCSLLVQHNSCKKEYDLPPVKQSESGSKINISMIKSKYMANMNYRFKADSNLYCVVTADEVSGNLFKEIFVRDATGALHVNMINSGGFYIGDSIRINLKGAVLNDYNRLIQLDSVDSDKNMVKLAAGYKPSPVIMSIGQILANTAATNSVQSKLVSIQNIEFIESDRLQTFADPIGKNTLNRILRSCTGETLALRTSGYSNIADKKTPGGNGVLTGIISQFGNSMQLLLRDISEVNMNGPVCALTNTGTTYLLKDFNDNNLTSEGWEAIKVNGAIAWQVTSGSNFSKVAECNNWLGSGNQPACETWLISRVIDLSAASAPTFSFESAFTFNGPVLETYISTGYVSGSPTAATWQLLNAQYGTNATFKPSGLIDLKSFRHKNARIAFKYVGNLNSGSKWQIDNIRVFEP